MRLLASAAILVMVGLAACAAPTPSATAAPPIQCSSDGNVVGVALSCHAAIALATAALPYNHPPLMRVSFQLGPYCAYSSGCSVGARRGDIGYVVFQYEPPAARTRFTS